MSNPISRFSHNLRILRESRGMTQGELGVAIGFKSHVGIVRLEKPASNPSLETMLRLCDVLRVDLFTLVFAEPFAGLDRFPLPTEAPSIVWREAPEIIQVAGYYFMDGADGGDLRVSWLSHGCKPATDRIAGPITEPSAPKEKES